VLAGSGELEAELKAQARARGLDEWLRFPGWVTNKAAFFAKTDIFCFTSSHDVCPVVLLEAFLYAKPVILTDCPGPREISENGVDSLLFVDDSEFELQQVSAALPDVRTIDARRYMEIADLEECQVPVTDESRNRRKMYRVETQRRDAAESFADDYIAFLRHCEIRLNIRPMIEENLQRVHELTQRTNQMNFSGNRYDRSVLKQILSTSYLDTYVLDVEDRFGTYGVVGFCIVDNRVPLMTDLMFSCRIQSKRVEHAFLAYLIRKYVAQTGKEFWANYRKTPRNAPSGQVFSDLGMEEFENQGGFSRLVFPKDRVLPDDGVVKITVYEPSSVA